MENVPHKLILNTTSNFLKENLSQKENELLLKANLLNPWFTIQNIVFSMESWLNALTNENIEHWLQKEASYLKSKNQTKKVGLILAGNIPMVGLHDLLCVWLSGNTAMIKLSSQDNILMKAYIEYMTEALPILKELTILSDGVIKEADAFIGTGSNNSARYFEYYFKNKPHIIRKNRNSVAVISNNTSDQELEALGMDIFSYFGMGCRNVTLLFIPIDFDMNRMIGAWEKHYEIIHHHKYANNYTYHKAILLMNLHEHLDTGYLLLNNKLEVHSPVSMLNYVKYHNIEEVSTFLEKESETIQCVASNALELNNQSVALGNTQKTMLWDYADNINTLQFLATI